MDSGTGTYNSQSEGYSSVNQHDHNYHGFDDTYDVPAGMAKEIWIDKYARRKPDGTYQSWAERIFEVVEGNFSLDLREQDDPQLKADRALSHEMARRGLYVMSGRHLQHGDLDQAGKMGELFTNCSTAMFSWTSFWLLMKGCFRAGTSVTMADGTKKSIEDVMVGEYVRAYDEATKKFVDRLVTKTHVNKPKPMVRVTFEDDSEVVCTFDHLFLTEGGAWMMARDLAGMDVCSQRGIASDALAA